MIQSTPQELHVSVDVGCYQHDKAGFADFFKQIEHFKKSSNGQVSIAMEGYNGHARPLDQMIQSKKYRLLNINN